MPAEALRIDFEPVGHKYRLNGQPVPSVTRVLDDQLEDWSVVPKHLLEAARMFGSHVHDACHLWNAGELDWSTLDPALVRYVEQWAEFVETNRITIIASELAVAHRLYKYAGRMDVLAEWDHRRVLLDIKSGAVPKTVGPQTAAYAEAYEYERKPCVRISRRYCVQLTGEAGKPAQLHQLKNPVDWPVFQSALNCWRFKNAT
jgi:hypothetical protein